MALGFIMRIFTSYINSLPSNECKIQVLASHLVAAIFIKYLGSITNKLYIASYKGTRVLAGLGLEGWMVSSSFYKLLIASYSNLERL